DSHAGRLLQRERVRSGDAGEVRSAVGQLIAGRGILDGRVAKKESHGADQLANLLGVECHRELDGGGQSPGDVRPPAVPLQALPPPRAGHARAAAGRGPEYRLHETTVAGTAEGAVSGSVTPSAYSPARRRRRRARGPVPR